MDKKPHERNEVRLGLPSKGRMATDTLDLLKVMYLHTNSIVQLISGVKILDEEFVSKDFADLFLFVFWGRWGLCCKGLSIGSEASESTAICCRNSSGSSIYLDRKCTALIDWDV